MATTKPPGAIAPGQSRVTAFESRRPQLGQRTTASVRSISRPVSSLIGWRLLLPCHERCNGAPLSASTSVMKIAIIGRGNVGSALARGLGRKHEVRTVGKEPAEVRQTAEWSELIVIAVPFGQVDAAAKEIGDAANGKTVIDVTNALNEKMQLALGHTTSGAEELQKKLAGAHVVKAFNTIFAQNMDKGRVKDRALTVFAAGDDQAAKNAVLGLARDIGFDAVDAGPLLHARYLEPLAVLNIHLGYVQKLGTDIGIALIH